MAYVKPQSPLKDKKSGDYFYPLTTADQVVMEDGSRLNSVFKHTVKTTVTLLATNWTETAPYTQTIVLEESVEDLNVDANVVYSGDKDTDLALNKAASCLSYIKKEGQNIIFYCLEKKPEIDIPVEIIYSSLNNIANIEEGVKLDFYVVAYATEEELLAATPAENTIGVVTSTPISSWIFSATEPTEPTEDVVWIATGTSNSGAFNALKKNEIRVYPQGAMQYIDGAWVLKTGKTYKDGQWHDWMLWLYDHGDTCDDITGGWTAEAWPMWPSGSVTTNTPPTLTLNSDHLYAKGANGGGVVRCVNQIDFTPYTKLVFDGILYTNDNNSYIYTRVGIWSEKTGWESNNVAIAGEATVAGTDGVIEIDVSAISGAYYVGVGLYYNTGSAVKMRGMRLE